MKYIITSNPKLIEVLEENGITLMCDDQMRITLSDEDAERIPDIVEEFAPAAAYDFTIEALS